MDPKLGDKSQPPPGDGRRQIEEETAGINKETRLSTLSDLLSGCHSFSLAIHIRETPLPPRCGLEESKLLGRRFPARVIPWHDFPDLQERIWGRINAEPTFSSQPLFASKRQLNSVSRLIEPITSRKDKALGKFEQLTVGDFVENIVDQIYENEPLRKQFFSSRKPSLQKDGNTEKRGRIVDLDGEVRETGSTPSSNDQFVMQAVWDEERRPLYVIEFKQPYELTHAELTSGLKEMEIARDVINQDEKSSFEHHSQHLAAAIITHLYDYMINTGVGYGYLYTGEAYLFLRIMDDPSVVQYFLSVPSMDVNAEEAHHLHRTAVAQVLTFTLNTLVTDPPTQDWYGAIAKRPKWKMEYLNVLRTVPDSIRRDPPFYECKPSPWQSTSFRSPLPHNPDSRALEECSIRPESCPITYRKGAPRQYCTMKCIQGLANGGLLDPDCPNIFEHGGGPEHPITAPEFKDQLHEQLLQDREKDFEQLHIYGATGLLLKASLSNFGYTVLIKATSTYFSPRLNNERKIYNYLRSIQGEHIPVCLGIFSPKVPYFYHGKVMTNMLILSWAGDRIQRPEYISDEEFLKQKRAELLSTLDSHGVEHRDKAWRNILWNRELGNLIAIDLEDAKRLSN